MHGFANKVLLVNEVLDLTRESKLLHKGLLPILLDTNAVSE